ncbi:YihY/virulence factor BrkB family protein [Leptolyngbya sp. FACHB-671]|uniref:YihY/virulence factor BrkB family protein n=1 Tax=Leptolyngbya sp. FACHB-671 TaxID=2692812 RepID=UPI001684CEF1|nr:YihY/virulence factor BrkB family protein [Leptolyngbya sp. FACHB-671]MBD1869885.1 YihY/virulence factor BrkB family protein [Cyanobacteria bacterium FACHB-471]MBD2068895.1 YihY/virulence factor BrkB family protein [Leptolyngbya sp. FACHB-671]
MISARFIRFFQHLNLATIRKTIDCVGKQRLPGLASEMAYNAMLALFPAILAVLTAIGLFQRLQTAFQRLADEVSELAPLEALGLIQGVAKELSESSNGGLFSLSFAIALWASSGALSAAMTALDQIHRIPPEKVRPFWKKKLISIGLTIGTILLLMLASTLIFVGDLIVRRLADVSLLETLWRLLTFPLALGIVSIAFAFVYRFGPSQWVPGKPILPGAVLAAISWAILSNLFRFYVAQFGNYNKAYGAVGAVIVLLLWLYMSSLVMLIGDQLNVTVGESMQRRAKLIRHHHDETEDVAIVKPDTAQPQSRRLKLVRGFRIGRK